MTAHDELICLTPEVTGLPFYLWLQRAGSRNICRLDTTTTPDRSDEPTLYRISPYQRISGPDSWTERALLSIFLDNNRTTVQNYWKGDYEDVSDVSSRIVPVDPDLVTVTKGQGANIFAWLDASEATYQATGVIDQSFRGIREPPPDHPEPD